VQQTGPGPALVDRIRAIAQKEGLLQGVDGSVDRAGGGEGSVEVSLALAGAAMLDDLWRGMVVGDQDVGEGLVVAQQHVETRAQTLDQVGFQEQGFGFGMRAHELHACRLRDHAGNAVRLTGQSGVADDPFLEAAGLADIKHVTVGVEHAVDAGRIRQLPDHGGNYGHPFFQGRTGVARQIDVGRALLDRIVRAGLRVFRGRIFLDDVFVSLNVGTLVR